LVLQRGTNSAAGSQLIGKALAARMEVVTMESWERTFQDRMHHFAEQHPSRDTRVPVSIKVRVDSGCFDRGCCPHAYEVIDAHVAKLRSRECEDGLTFEQHESGPEILVYLAVATAGLTVAKSVIDLVATIIKARNDGVKMGDRHSQPVELIIRRMTSKGKLREERILRIHSTDEVDDAKIGKLLSAAAKKIGDDSEEGS
jgi:hypothetical protein